MLLSVFVERGAGAGFFLDVMGLALRGLLGVGALIVPVALLFVGLSIVAALQTRPLGHWIIPALCLLVIALSAYHLLAPAGSEFLPSIREQYGGAVGAFFAYLLRKAVGPAGAWVVLIVGALACVSALVGRPLAEQARALVEAVVMTGAAVGSRVAEWRTRLRRRQVARPAARARRVRPSLTAPTPRFSESPLASKSAPAETASSDEGSAPSAEKVAAEQLPEQAEQLRIPEVVTALKQRLWKLPPISLLSQTESEASEEVLLEEIEENVKRLEETLASFNVPARVIGYERGPAVTRYEVEIEKGIRVVKVVNLVEDLAMALAVPDVRVEAPIPGRSAIGIEVPNRQISLVPLREVLETEQFQRLSASGAPLKFGLGKDIAGHPIVGDLSRMPHLLIGGATNSGKSVCLNSIITSLLLTTTPDQVRLILVDPKRVELSIYEGIPNLYAPIVHDAHEASYTLRQAIREMERRYRLFAPASVKNISEYNARAAEKGYAPLPYIVILIDELADLMMQGQVEFERLICRLAQLARATGIHLVVATQRPSVNVITGTIKANIP